MPSALASLRSLGSNLTPALRKIADYVRDNPEQLLYQTVVEVADASGSSEASVIRFCRDMGFSGFQDFKLSLAQDLATSPVGFRQEKPTSSDGVADYLQATANQVLEDTRRLMNITQLEQVVERLMAARRIDFYGVGNAGSTAWDYALKFQRLGLAALAFPDPHSAAISAATLGMQDVAFGLSVSGSSIDTVKALEIARQSGAYTVPLPCRTKSPIPRHAQTVLLSSAPESPLTRGSLSAKMGHLLILDFLFTQAVLRHPKGSEILAQTAAAVADRSY